MLCIVVSVGENFSEGLHIRGMLQLILQLERKKSVSCSTSGNLLSSELRRQDFVSACLTADINIFVLCIEWFVKW